VSVGYVGVPLDGEKLFYGHVHLHGGPAPVRRFLPELIDLVWKGKTNPGIRSDFAARLSGRGLPRDG